MTDHESRPRPEYQEVRDAFARLKTQDKAAFVLESLFDTFGHAVRDAGRHVADVIETVGHEDFFDDLFRRRRPAESGATAPGAAEAASPSGSAAPPDTSWSKPPKPRTPPASAPEMPDEGPPTAP